MVIIVNQCGHLSSWTGQEGCGACIRLSTGSPVHWGDYKFGANPHNSNQLRYEWLS